MALVPGHVFWASCTTIPPDRLFRIDPARGTRQALVARLDCPDGVVVARGWVYWASDATIGRVKPDGSGLNRSLVTATHSDAGGVADGLATDGNYLYFSRCRCPTSTIARVRLDGSGLDRDFISIPYRYFCPMSLSYAAGHLYWMWTDDNTPAGRSYIARASTSGDQLDPKWLDLKSSGNFNTAVVDGRLYWEWGGGAGSPVCVGEASLRRRILRKQFLCGAQTVAAGP